MWTVESAIDSLNVGIGFDGLHSNHFKLGGKMISEFLSRLFSSFIKHGYVPKKMLQGEILPLPKEKLGNTIDSDNYRPVTTSSNCLKLFEYCIFNHLDENIILNGRQFGFRKHTSTVMATTILQETIAGYTLNGSSVFCAFLDLSKAFDNVNHSKLISKLIRSNISPSIVNTLNHIYSNQYVKVKFNGIYGQTWRLCNGVRQGGVISPILFNLYINEVLERLNNLNIGCILDIQRHNSQGYADDLTLLAPSSESLKYLLIEICKILNELNLSLNAQKSVCMIFNPKSEKILFLPKFLVNGTELKIVNSFKYLGIIISNDLKIKEDIKRCECAFLRQFYSIFRRFHFAEKNIMLFLFRSHCLSMYGTDLWYNSRGSTAALDHFAINYHKCIKQILGKSKIYGNHDACEEAGLPTLKHLINWKMISFAFNLMNSKSPCLLNYKSYLITDSKIFKEVKNIFCQVYSLQNVFDNDFDAVISRISFVQAREPRRVYVPTINIGIS